MRQKLEISKDLQLPLDVVTATQVIYGGKGMGKTNLGSVLVEELAKVDLRFSVIDPLGVWWGLKHGADKARPGIECLLLGGVHGDLPIEPAAGGVVADLVADEVVSTVIDISRRPNGKMWSIGERIRFVADFCTRLYERQGERRIPLHLIVDEAARFAPQVIPRGAIDVSRCAGAVAVIVEEGRNVGIGMTLITQRSARMAKAVSELADAMIAFRTVGPNSIGAIVDWLGEHVPKERWKDMIERLRKLPRGSALVVSPGWLEFEGVVQIRARETFDSSSTPKAGHTLRAPGKARKPDLAKYQERMAATIEKAKAEDPRELRRRIAELERQVAAKPAAAPAPAAKVEVPVVKREHLTKLKEYALQLVKAMKRIEQVEEAWRENIREGARRIDDLCRALDRAGKPTPVGPTFTVHAPRPLPLRIERGLGEVAAAATKALTAEGDLSRPQLRILESILAFELLGVFKVDKNMIAAFAGASPTSSAYTNNLGRLRTLGLIEYPTPGEVALTAAGHDRAPAPQPIARRDQMHEAWYRVLSRPQAAILRIAISVYPEAIGKEALATHAGASPTSSAYTNNLGRLRSLGAITYPSRGEVRAADILFPAGLN